jgi:hypothetical protein
LDAPTKRALIAWNQEYVFAVREEDMLEYVAYSVLGVVLIACMLYVTMSPETEDTRTPTGPDSKQ